MKTTPLIELQDITKSYEHVDALRRVDFAVNPGEIVAIVGDNGAGKSTLMHVMAGLIQPTSGTIRRNGEPITIPSVRAAADLGIATVFQGQELCENLDVASNLFLGHEARRGALNTVRDDEAMRRRAREALATLSAAIRPTQAVASLSGGQRQTVTIARTLLHDPDLILLDEPTASLSVIQTAEVLEYIKRLRSRGCSIVMICHTLPDVFAISDRIAVMRRGRILAIHNTRDVTYEQVIAEISGVRDPNEVNRNIRKISRHVRPVESEDGQPA
ncbi:ATP-binding cassette domain-containing protein [Bifidobacterium choloepi]|uniref:Sugar ABC transporter ATP-binding protein n=1 Tax=Bifidobacterium choloepi TaxID=2614131 RepID=A0A6I5NI38_9BIFI|nr:ATP-binding cassette domain-containing protein [Bifidobacterium choloepi]NEG70003.1 sugar ABC transporter ATP-binding protein [Bifidobacterium choloepi]